MLRPGYSGDDMMIRRAFTVLIAAMPAIAAGAGEIEFSLNLDTFRWTPKQDARTKARLAEWNDPMGRLLYPLVATAGVALVWLARG